MTTEHLPELGPGPVCTYGQLLLDHVVALRRPLEINGQVDGVLTHRLGGSGLIVGRATNQLDVPTRFLGHCGEEKAADEWIRTLEDEGIETQLVRRGRAGSTLAIQLASGESALIHDTGDRLSMTPDDIKDEWLNNASAVYVSCFDLYYEKSRPAMFELLRQAAQRNIPYAVDLGVASLLYDYGRDRIVSFFEEFPPAVVFCNESEGEAIGLPRPVPNVPLLVQHRGAAATRVFVGSEVVEQVSVIPLLGARDFVGAGGAFAGGFLAAWHKHLSLPECIRTAHNAATTQIQSVNAPS